MQREILKAAAAPLQSTVYAAPSPKESTVSLQATPTTSSGLAWSLGKRDNAVSRNETIAHLRAIVEAVDVPVNADFEDGFATVPTDVARNVKIATTTGVSGLSIEDSSGDEAETLFDFTLAVERISAARRSIDESGTGILLTARSEGFIVGRPDVDETVRRLVAYAEAGADCLYAPGIRATADIVAVVQAVAPKPVNVLVGSDFTTVSDLAALGVRRISVGGALARVAWAGLLTAATEIAGRGTFAGLSKATPFAELNQQFAAPARRR